MVSKRTLILGVMALFALAGGVTLSESQSAFPIRFETPGPTNPVSQTSTGSLAIETATHYYKRVTFDGASGAEDILDITGSQDNTTLLLRVLASARIPDSESPGTLVEVIGSALFDTTDGTWEGLVNHLTVNLASGTTGIIIDLPVVGPKRTVVVQTPANHSLLTLTIEVVTNKAVTFFEHF